MAAPRKRTLPRKPRPTEPPPPPPPPRETRPMAVVDMGASAIRLVVAEAPPGEPRAHPGRGHRAASCSARTPSPTAGSAPPPWRRRSRRWKASAGSWTPTAWCATARWPRARCARRRTATPSSTACGCAPASTSRSSTAPRRTGSPTWPCARRCATTPRSTAGDALLVEVGGGSADISFLRKGAAHPLRDLRAGLDPHAPEPRLLAGQPRPGDAPAAPPHPQRGGRHPARDAAARGAALHRAGRRRALRRRADPGRRAPRAAASPCSPASRSSPSATRSSAYDVEQLVERYRLPQAEAETLVPALLAYRELLLETAAEQVTVPDASLRAGLLLDLARAEDAAGHRGLPPPGAGQRRRPGREVPLRRAPRHARWPQLAVRLFDELRAEHGLSDRHRLLLEVAALLHDVGNYVNLRGHHKHTLVPARRCPRSSGSRRTTWRSWPTWRATIAGPCPRSRTCPTWRSTARRAWRSTSWRPSCAWPTPSTPTTCRRSRTCACCPRTATGCSRSRAPAT